MQLRTPVFFAVTAALVVTVISRHESAEAIGFRSWVGSGQNGFWSDINNWSNFQKPEDGDFVTLGITSLDHGSTVNDIPGLTLARLTISDTRYTVSGNPLEITESVLVTDGATRAGISANISGTASMLISQGNTLELSGNNTFTGDIDIAGYLEVGSNSALGSAAGRTRVFAEGRLQLIANDLGQETIVLSPKDTPGIPGILVGPGTSLIRNLQVTGINTIASLGQLELPNGIDEFAPGMDIYLATLFDDDIPPATFVVGGASVGTGFIRVVGDTNLVWNSTSALALRFEPFFDLQPAGDLTGSGSADSLVFGGGTFAPGSGNTVARFDIAKTFAAQNGTLSFRLNSPTPATGYSQVRAGAGVAIGPGTALDLALGFTPPVGTAFRIIDNTSNQPIAGAFSGLAEGATFQRTGQTWQITYKGGDGNDVVVTRVASDPRPFKRIVPMVAKS